MRRKNKNTKEISIETYEGEYIFDLLLRTEKIFKQVRLATKDINKVLNCVKTHEKIVIQYAELLEEIAMDIGTPHLYSDSNYIANLKDRHLADGGE